MKAVDLRPALKAARSQGAVYLRYDSHWTPRGAIAGYNAVIEADGRPDWRVDPATALGPPAIRKGGDVARIAGVQDEVTEMVEGMTLSAKGADEPISEDVMPDHVIATGVPGKTIMVIGDFVHAFLLHGYALPARGTRDLDPSSSLRVRLAPDRQVPSRRSVVGAD